MHYKRLIAFVFVLCVCFSQSIAQPTNRDFSVGRMLIDDGAGHTLRIGAPLTGWPSTGTFDYFLPIPPGGLQSGFVERGSASNIFLQWDSVSNYWKSTSALSGIVSGTGTDNYLLKWFNGGTQATSSHLFDNGSTVSINNASPSPSAVFQVTNGSILFDGVTGPTPVSGAGTRFMWIPSYAALRAGTALSNEWDDAKIGVNSVAFGYSAIASGYYSFSSGFNTLAFGASSIAMGVNARGIGNNSVAIGTDNLSQGDYSVALGNSSTARGAHSAAIGQGATTDGTGSFATGNGTIATGDYSTALGFSTIAGDKFSFAAGNVTYAGGLASVALGNLTNASGTGATALGTLTLANGDYSTALGYHASTNSMMGSFAYGDASTDSNVLNTANNQFMVRASGGTVFYSDSASSVGAELLPNANSWSTVSDSNRKENRLLANGEAVLDKIGAMWLGSWNYIGQNPKEYRHYGPMAQEFYTAFGHDTIGKSGNDTTISTADAIGINMIAIQALINRTTTLAQENQQLKEQNTQLAQELSELRTLVMKIAATNNTSLTEQASLK